MKRIASKLRSSKSQPPIIFIPSGPVREMLDVQVQAEEKRGFRNVRTRIIERCIADQLGRLHPDLWKRFQIIDEERWPQPLLIEQKQAA